MAGFGLSTALPEGKGCLALPAGRQRPAVALSLQGIAGCCRLSQT